MFADKRMGITDNEDFIPVEEDGVWITSTTQMNLLYSMDRWASRNNIDTEDDWDAWVRRMDQAVKLLRALEFNP